VPLTDPELISIVERRRIVKKICRRCGAINPPTATKCRRCKSRNLRLRKRLGGKK